MLGGSLADENPPSGGNIWTKHFATHTRHLIRFFCFCAEHRQRVDVFQASRGRHHPAQSRSGILPVLMPIRRRAGTGVCLWRDDGGVCLDCDDHRGRARDSLRGRPAASKLALTLPRPGKQQKVESDPWL